jgi:hypothetical protein
MEPGAGTEEKDADTLAFEARWAGVELELGRLIIAWSKVEFYVSRIFVGLAKLQEPAATLLIKRLKGEGMSAIIFGLLKRWDAAEAEPITAWMKHVQAIREERNNLFHGAMVDQFDGVEWQPTNINYMFDAEGVATLGGPRLTAEGLAELRAKMVDAQRDYGKLPEVAWEGITIND